MHSVRVSSQLLVSVLFIAVPTNTENFKFFLHLYMIQFSGLFVLRLLLISYVFKHRAQVNYEMIFV